MREWNEKEEERSSLPNINLPWAVVAFASLPPSYRTEQYSTVQNSTMR